MPERLLVSRVNVPGAETAMEVSVTVPKERAVGVSMKVATCEAVESVVSLECESRALTL